MGIGETLAKERQDAGLTVTQVSMQTRIRETVIRGIERNDYAPCGGNFYARGHIRSISRVIGIDPEPLIRDFDETHGGAPQPVSAVSAFEAEAPMMRFRERRSPNWSAAMAVALVLVLVYAVVKVVGGGDGEARTAQPVARPTAAQHGAPKPVAPPKDSVALAPRKNVEVRVKAKRSSWLNVRDDNGKQLFSGLIRAGETKDWTAKKRIRVLIGNGGGVTLIVNGKDLGAPGTDGQVLRLSFGPGDPDGA